MDESTATPLKDDQSNSPPEELTKEKLIAKCKNLLTIAQKAKKARDECTEKNKVLSEDYDKLNNKVLILEKDLVTAQEMLVTFTDQKLKLSMHMDELKKDRKQLTEDLQNVTSVKDQLETENISLKRQYTRIITENEDLITQLGETENRLKNAVTLKTDIDKLQENNESIKHLCSSVTEEKLALEKEYTKLNQKISTMETEWNKWQEYISSKFNVNNHNVESWITVINSNLESKVDVKTEEVSNVKLKLIEENDKCNKLNSDLQQTASNLSSVESERNDLQIELKKYIEMNKQLKNELNSLNEDKDKMMSNLENMRIETRQLIESSEKLSEEIEVLKFDKSKVENDLTSILDERNSLSMEVGLKNSEINKLSANIDSLLNELQVHKTKINEYEKSRDDLSKIQDNLKLQLEMNKNLHQQTEHLNEQIKNFEDKSVKSVEEINRLTELLGKTQTSETNLKAELKAAVDNFTLLQNKIKEMEPMTQMNASVKEIIDEKDRYISHLKTEIDSLKTKFENYDDSFSKQLESLKFEKEELKCLVDTLKEEQTENNNKYTQELNEKQELLSQSLIREKKIFEEFKTNLIEIQNNNEKLSTDYSDIEKYCNEKCLEVEKLTQDIIDGQKKIEILENEILNINKQFSDVNELLSEASKLNQKFEQELKESQNKFNKLQIENDNLKSSLDQESSSLKELQAYRKESDQHLENLKSELSSICDDAKTKDNQITDLKHQLENVNLAYNNLKIKLDGTEQEMNLKETDICKKNETIISLENELKTSKTTIAELESKLKISLDENNQMKELINQRNEDETEASKAANDMSAKYEEEISMLESTLRERSAELDSCRRTWIGHLTILKGAFFGLKHSYDDLKKSVRDLQEFLTTLSSLTPINFQEKIDNCIDKALKSSKQDLLSEMQHMNQALKQRGEVISKLQNSIAEMEQKVIKSNEDSKQLEKNLAESSAILEDKEKQIKFKELFIKDLEAEISRFRETNDSMTEGDMMSSSTISKVEEAARLKDVEDSFEDKYTKLKLLAMKLKKRVNDLSAALEEEKNKSASERSELIDKAQSLTTAAKNAQKLQESFDSMMDNYEEEKKKCKNLETSLQNSAKIQEDLKADMTKLETEVKKIPNMKKHIESLTLNVSNAKKELTALNKEKEVEVIKYSELKKEKTKLEEKVSELTSSLEQALQQSRNNNLLELEMNNYEKTIEDLSAQLNCEKDKLLNIKGEMESMSSVKSGLEEQIKLLENQIKIEEERNSLSNKQLTTVKETLSEVQALLSEKTDKCELLEKDLQEEKQKYESMAVQATTVTSQFTAKEKELETQLNSFQRIVCGFESKIASRDEEISRCQAELERVQGEFDAYRARAQAVLAKQRSETVSHAEREATEQIDKLNHQNNILTNKIDSLMSELEMMKTESLTYSHEKERSDRRMEEMNKMLQYKSAEIDKISTEFRNFKISTETLKQCFKNEVEEKDLSYKNLIEDYKRQIDDLNNANKVLESQVGSGLGSFPAGEDVNNIQQDNIIESLPQQREEGEGSESVPSPQIRKRSTNMVPLDVLLNTPYDSESRIGLLCDRISLLEKEVSTYEVRCRHLAGLLSEAERDSARNSQLNSLLKEEIRRLERSLQRQPHAANTEYLKNVIFKFVTLQSGDEKSRLVPVLDTILKLSPEETTKLNAVAKGEVGSGWGNYLSSWTGL